MSRLVAALLMTLTVGFIFCKVIDYFDSRKEKRLRESEMMRHAAMCPDYVEKKS